MPMKITVMKNRFRKLLALIMALVIFGSAIPMTYAETAACIEGCSESGHAEGCPNAAVKRLFAVWSHGGEPMDSITIAMDKNSPLVFRYGTDLEDSIPVSFDELISPNVTLSKSTDMTSEYGEVIRISPAILGTGTVGYTKDPAVSFSLHGILYEGNGSALIARGSSNNYMSELWVHPDSALTVTFLMATTPDDDSNCQEILPSQLTASEGVSLEATGNGNEVSVTATANGSITYGEHTMELYYTGSGGGDQCTEETPHLFTTWTNGTGHMHESNIGIESSSPLIFYFGTKDNAVSIPFSELSRSGIATLTDENGNLIPNAVSLGINGIGEGAVQYTVGETTYSYPVIGKLRNYSCYTAPERSSENYTGSFFPDEEDTVTLYLMWGDDQPKPQNVTAVAYDGQNGQPEEEAVPVVGFAAVDYDDYIQVTFPMVEKSTVILRWDDSWESIYLQNGTLDNGGDGGNNGNWTVTVDYGGTPVTVGIGVYMGDFMSLSQGYLGDSFNPDHPRDYRFDIYFAALSNFGDPVNETTAPQDFFNAVSNVTFYVKSFVNTDGSDPSIPNVSFTEVTRGEHAGRNTYKTALQAAQKKFYSAVIAMQFTYQGQVYEITNESHYTYSGDIVLDASSLDTAEKLNAVLTNSDTLLNWFETAHPMQFASFSGEGTNMITLELPAIRYDDVITVCGSRVVGSQREKTFYGIELRGTTQNRMTTTLPGLVCKGFVSGVTNIHFVAQPGKTVTYDGDTFTCGILVDCSGVNTVGDFVDTEVCWINDCTFRGFKYGIRATKDGFAGSTSSCKFLDNTFGYYMDCDGGIRGGNTSYTHNTFINNGCAVTIKSLPQETTAYRIRFTDSVFTHNGWDFHVLVRARFYFYRNWYGHYPLMPFSDEIDYDTLTPESRSALIDDNSDIATVVSNPRRMALDSLDLGVDNASGLHSMILNSEAADLLVSGLALETLTGTADIPVLGDNEEEIGIWTFGGE